MRSRLVLPAVLLVACAATPARAQTRELPVCPSRENARMLMQAGAGASLPQDCRRVAIRRLDTPSGPVCVIDFGRQDGGLVGAMRDAVAATERWTACANLRSP